MKLSEYLAETGMSQAEFARRAGVSGPTIASILLGRDVKLSVGVRIEIASKGRVRCKDCANMEYVNKKMKIVKRKNKLLKELCCQN